MIIRHCCARLHHVPARRLLLRATSSSSAAAAAANPTSTNYFDTHAAAKVLGESGLSPAQTDAVVAVVANALQANALIDADRLRAARAEFVPRVAFAERTGALELLLNEKVAHVRDELKDKEHNDMRELRADANAVDKALTGRMDGVVKEMALINERRNIGREVMEKKWLGELERLENRLIKFAIGFAGTTAIVALGVLRVAGMAFS